MDAMKPFNDLFKLWRGEPTREDKKLPELFVNQAIYNPDMPMMPSKGKYPKGYPEGLIIHYTAGTIKQSGQSAIELAIKNGHQYFFIDYEGNLFQQFSLDSWGYHAGESICPITKRKSVSRYYAGVEIACPGALDVKKQKYYTWFNQEVGPENVRYFAGTGTQPVGGFFHKFSPKQEETLLKLCLMFCRTFEIDPEFIMGHDEVSPKRKQDPGGSLSLNMMRWREKIMGELLKVPPA